ncbi:MAG TPA: hypothetical protein VE544_02115 [Nitrososphaeraceae archaeon]|nr:hypothetical protein [Nitrososphaeraceae archaeon]
MASPTFAELSRIITSGFNTMPTGEESRLGSVVGPGLFSTDQMGKGCIYSC